MGGIKSSLPFLFVLIDFSSVYSGDSFSGNIVFMSSVFDFLIFFVALSMRYEGIA